MTSFSHRMFGLVGVLSIALSLVAVPLGTQAALGDKLREGLKAAAPDELKETGENPTTIVANVLSAALSLLGLVLFGYFLYGGYLWMTAGGDGGQVKNATAVIKNAVIGLVIIVLAYAIANFVITALGNAASGTQPATPSGSA